MRRRRYKPTLGHSISTSFTPDSGGNAHVFVVEDDLKSLIALELIERRNSEATAKVLRKANA